MQNVYKIRIFILAKTSNQDNGKVFESTLYKDFELPFLPTLDLRLSFDNSTVLPPIKEIVWNVFGNFFVCRCADELKSENIGVKEHYHWHTDYINQEYKDKGWSEFQFDFPDSSVLVI